MSFSASPSPDLNHSIKPGCEVHFAMALTLTPKSISTNQVLRRSPTYHMELGAVSIICVMHKGGRKNWVETEQDGA